MMQALIQEADNVKPHWLVRSELYSNNVLDGRDERRLEAGEQCTSEVISLSATIGRTRMLRVAG